MHHEMSGMCRKSMILKHHNDISISAVDNRLTSAMGPILVVSYTAFRFLAIRRCMPSLRARLPALPFKKSTKALVRKNLGEERVRGELGC